MRHYAAISHLVIGLLVTVIVLQTAFRLTEFRGSVNMYCLVLYENAMS